MPGQRDKEAYNDNPASDPHIRNRPNSALTRGGGKRKRRPRGAIIANPLAYTPGTKYVYSCNAYILLGFIAEKIYGAPLDRLFEKYIKEPLGLTRSRFNIALDEPDAVISYRWREPGKYRVDDENVQIMGGIAGSGANFWTLRDIDVFCKAVMEKSGKLWAPYLYDLAEKDYTPGAQFEESRGLGWLVVDKRLHSDRKTLPGMAASVTAATPDVQCT